MGRNEAVDQTAYIQLDGQPPSAEIRKQLKAENRPVLLSFSRGKDSVAAWLALRDDNIPVVAFHMTLIPGLSFVDESLREFEDYFGQHIYDVPHPSFYRWLCRSVFIPPERRAVIDAARLYEYNYLEVADVFRDRLGLDHGTWMVEGVRAADSPDRRTSIKMHGAMKPNMRKVSAVWDWRIRHVRAAIAEHKPPMPIDYDLWGRSFDGMDYRFLEPLKRERPNDYQRVLDWFPLAELELFRAEL